MIERGFVIAAIVKDVAEVDARFGVIGIHLQRTARRSDRRFIVAESVLSVADARNSFGGVGRLLRGDLEKFLRLFDQTFAKKRTADLEHQLHIVLITKFERATEIPHRILVLAEFEQGLAKSGECVLVIRIENEGFLEAAPGPRVFFARMVCVANPYVELYRIRVEAESFFKYGERFVVISFVVQLVCSLVVLFRTQKRCWHTYAPSEESSLTYCTP